MEQPSEWITNKAEEMRGRINLMAQAGLSLNPSLEDIFLRQSAIVQYLDKLHEEGKLHGTGSN